MTWLHHLWEWVDIFIFFYSIIFNNYPWLYYFSLEYWIEARSTWIFTHLKFEIPNLLGWVTIWRIFKFLSHPKPIWLMISPHFIPYQIPLIMTFSKFTLILIKVCHSCFLLWSILVIKQFLNIPKRFLTCEVSH